MKKSLKTLFFFALFLPAARALAVVFEEYQVLTPIPGLEGGTVPTTGGDLSPYLGNLYTMGVAAAAGLAVIMVIWGGVEYITSVAGEGKSGGKERITSAILGLLLALGSYIILNTINPDLLSLKFGLEDADIKIENTNQTGYQGGQVNGADLSGTGYTIDSNGSILYNNQQTGYLVDSDGDIVDSDGNPASYINDTPLNISNFSGSFKTYNSNSVPDSSIGSANSSLANLLAQSATNAYGQNLGQGTYQRVACASTTCSILNNSGLNYGNITGTANLSSRLSADSRFQAIDLGVGGQINPSILRKGDVVNTVTSGGVSGHVGVVNTNGLISNNDSDTGLIKETPVSNWNSGIISKRPTLRTIIYRPK